MSNKDLLTELQKEANFIQSHLQRLGEKPDEISGIDIDMLADKLKDLYAKIFEVETEIAIIKIKEPSLVTVEEKPPVVEVKKDPEITTPKAPEMEVDDRIMNKEQGTRNKEVEADTEIFDQQPAVTMQDAAGSNEEEEATRHEARDTKHEDIEEPAVGSQDPASSIQDPVSETEPDPEPEVKTTADLFSGPTTIAEKFEVKEDKSIAARVSPQAVENLKMAIGINDKFLFINALFKGNPTEYNEAIDKLNEAGSMPLAESAMQEFSDRYEWSDQSEAFARLKKIVSAKFN